MVNKWFVAIITALFLLVVVPTALACNITSLTTNSTYDLGSTNAIKGTITIVNSNNPLVGASCMLQAYDTSNNSLVISSVKSVSDGEFIFNDYFNSDYWVKNNNYTLKVHCFCINDSDDACYNESNGADVGFRSCSYEKSMTTGVDDRKEDPLKMIGLMIGISLVSFLLIYFAFKIELKDYWTEIMQFGISLFAISLLMIVGGAAVMNQGTGVGSTFFSAILWFVRFLWVFIFIYFSYKALHIYKNKKRDGPGK